MANYYFLVPSLPPLAFAQKPELSFEELVQACAVNLERKDREKVVRLRRYIDLVNIRFLLLEKAVDPRGNFSEKELDEALLLKSDLPQYVFDFLDRYQTVGEKLRVFPGLIALFFREEIAQTTGFLERYFSFERAYTLITTTLRAKRLKRDLVRELQFEDLQDPLVGQILAQKDSEHYDPPAEYVELKETYLSSAQDPWVQYEVMAKWRLKKIEELATSSPFSVDWILAYMASLFIVERSCELSEAKGKVALSGVIG